ncbi:MAG: anaerobic ribonucleoside-triphosphate reductase activating protein [Bacteroidales bacterium]|nr:anaerobic ribonucleoside-triphosphate reductase activating protein [Bacteroidales bacterium]
MLKYLNTDVVFQEIPGEVSLAINITGCPCRCPGCHSQYLWGDIGEPLTEEALDKMIDHQHHNITCVALMGGDAIPAEIDRLMSHLRKKHPSLHTAWYSGRTTLSSTANLANYDYIKLGPYLKHLGALRSRNTNQRLYRVHSGKMQDMTSSFWRS